MRFQQSFLFTPCADNACLLQRVEIVLEQADLVARPFLGQRGEGVGRGAGAVIVEGRRLSAKVLLTTSETLRSSFGCRRSADQSNI